MLSYSEIKRHVFNVSKQLGLVQRNKIVSAQEDLVDYVMPEAERNRIQAWVDSSKPYQVRGICGVGRAY